MGSACPAYELPKVIATVDHPELSEISGVVESAGSLWVHNDSGNPASLFQLSLSGEITTRLPLPVVATDWEDMGVERGESGARTFYVGDIGDNKETRQDGIVVHVVPEPDPRSVGHQAADPNPVSFRLHYPDRPRDAEALLIDPTFRELLLVTKPLGGWPEVFVAPLPLYPDTQLRFAARLKPALTALPLHLVTAADVSSDGGWIVLRTYTSLYLFRRLPHMLVADALSTQPCELSAADEPQGEAVAFGEGGHRGSPPPIFTVSEGRPTRIIRYDPSGQP